MESMDNKHLKTQDEIENSEKTELDNVEKKEEPTTDEAVVDDKTEIPTEDESVQEIEDQVTEEVVEAPQSEVEPEVVNAAPEVVEEPVLEAEKEQEVEMEAAPEVEAEDVSELEATAAEDSIEEEEPSNEEAISEQQETEVTESETNEPVEEVVAENTTAEEASKVVEEEKKEEEVVDYTTFAEIDLINEFRNLMENKPFLEIYHKIDQIKIAFYKRNKQRVAQLKKEFLAGGGFEETFKPEANPYEPDMKTLLEEFRQLKTNHTRDLENEKEKNLQLKYDIIEEIKNLVNRKESINKTFQEFKELQQSWHDTGLVPQAAMKDLWDTYHHHVENFYDYIKINKELRDLDLKKNMEQKISLCEKAEELLLEPSVLKAFNSLQKLHDAWREIGPVPRDKKEELWERFKEATTKINKKHQDFFENRKKVQKKNLEAKTALCEKVEEILNVELGSHKEWEDKSRELVELQKYWRTIGFTPKKENNAIYERFRLACDSFFDRKREYYSKHKEIQNTNLQQKIDLCLQAEALKDSTDWKKTTDEFIAIQKKWKEIGPVPRKHSDSIWKRFRAACDFFFENKSAFFNTKDESQLDNLKLKKELIQEVKAFKTGANEESDLEKLREFQRRWTEIGHVPIGDKNTVQKEFRDAINLLFDKLSVEDKERNLIRFKNKVTDWKGMSRGHNKIYAERDKYIAKLKQLESDLITLKNNIGFFANSKNAEALIKDVKRKIENNEEQIVYLKEKIRVIDDVEFNEE